MIVTCYNCCTTTMKVPRNVEESNSYVDLAFLDNPSQSLFRFEFTDRHNMFLARIKMRGAVNVCRSLMIYLYKID